MITRIENEIIELHQFFQDWYNIDSKSTVKSFERCKDVLDTNFSIISPSGVHVFREQLLQNIMKAHNTLTDMRIWIRNIQIQHQVDKMILATYEEWQEISCHTTSRLSSVLFHDIGIHPDGLLWLHVHETWINT